MGERSKLSRHTQQPAPRCARPSKEVMERGGRLKMRMNMRTLCAAVFTVVLLLSVVACKKKVAAAPPPPPPVNNPPPPPPTPAAAARINALAVKARIAASDPSLSRRVSGFEVRRQVQRGKLKLPPYPTTTIGSF